MVIVGIGDICWSKAAVMVTVEVLFRILSASVLVKLAVGSANKLLKLMVWLGVHPLTPGVHKEVPSIAPMSAADPWFVWGTITFNVLLVVKDLETVFVSVAPLSIKLLLIGW